MKISIITTCYNREATIRDSIESVLSQDYFNIEYIVVDGASKDQSMNIINEYKDRISTIISEPDNGMYEAINKGIRAATGDFIGLMHSDDLFYDNQIISKLVKQLKQTNSEIIYGNGIFVDKSTQAKVVRNWISGEYKKRKMRRGWLPLHPTVYIKKECFDKIGLYNENYKIAADSDLLIRYLGCGEFKITYFNDYVVIMRMGGLSTNPLSHKKRYAEGIRIYKSYGFNPYLTLARRIISKIPQFISAKFFKNK